MSLLSILPGNTLLSQVLYAILGVILPLFILLYYNNPGIGYYLGFFLWLIGLILILPESPLWLSTKGKNNQLISFIYPVLASSGNGKFRDSCAGRKKNALY